MFISFSVSNLERDATISVKPDSECLAFASYVRLVNLCLLLFAELGDLQQSFSRSQVAVDYYAKEFCQVRMALMPILLNSNVLHAYFRGAILLSYNQLLAWSDM